MGELWAVTAYFNPLRYATRLANYRMFSERLPVPLLAVELGFDGRFDLDNDAADVVIRRTGRDVLWHKERLLNEAIDALPARCDRAFLSAACGRQEDFVVKLGMNARQADHYLAWASPVAAQFAGNVASLDSDVLHLWHGDMRDRA